MQEPSIQRILNAVRRQDVTCVPEECVTLEKRRNGYPQVLVGWENHGHKPHPDHINENGKSNVYVIPGKYKGAWYPRYFIYRQDEGAWHPTPYRSYKDSIQWIPSLHEAIFLGEQAARMRTGSKEDYKAHDDFILFAWEQKARVKLLEDGTKVEMDSSAPQKNDEKEKSALQGKGKGRKRGQSAQGDADAAPKRKRGKPSCGDVVDGTVSMNAGSEDCQGVRQSINEDQDDEEPEPIQDEKKHIILVNDDVEDVAGRSQLTVPSSNGEVPSTGGEVPSTDGKDEGDLVEVELGIRLCKAREALYQNRIEELQLQQKKLALEKNLRPARMATGVPES